jgi:hypothetical protein
VADDVRINEKPAKGKNVFVETRGGFTSFNPPYPVPYIYLLVGWIKVGGRIHIFMDIMLDLYKFGIHPSVEAIVKSFPHAPSLKYYSYFSFKSFWCSSLLFISPASYKKSDG